MSFWYTQAAYQFYLLTGSKSQYVSCQLPVSKLSKEKKKVIVILENFYLC